MGRRKSCPWRHLPSLLTWQMTKSQGTGAGPLVLSRRGWHAGVRPPEKGSLASPGRAWFPSAGARAAPAQAMGYYPPHLLREKYKTRKNKNHNPHEKINVSPRIKKCLTLFWYHLGPPGPRTKGKAQWGRKQGLDECTGAQAETPWSAGPGQTLSHTHRKWSQEERKWSQEDMCWGIIFRLNFCTFYQWDTSLFSGQYQLTEDFPYLLNYRFAGTAWAG